MATTRLQLVSLFQDSNVDDTERPALSVRGRQGIFQDPDPPSFDFEAVAETYTNLKTLAVELLIRMSPQTVFSVAVRSELGYSSFLTSDKFRIEQHGNPLVM